MSSGEVTYANEADGKRDLCRRKRAELKHSVYMFAHMCWWRFLFAIRLARLYSIALCNLNLYRKWQDGRCHWCGLIHGKIKKAEGT